VTSDLPWDLADPLAAFERPPAPVPPTPWELPPPGEWPPGDLIGVGADLAPGTLVAAYRAGLFPMYVRRRRLGWWSPDPRGIIPLDGLRVSRSLRQSCRRFTVAVDHRFRDVVEECAASDRDGGWITPDLVEAYVELHHRGWAHSVEVFGAEGDLAGGLYGVRIGGLFAGESMFHRRRDASKVALVALVGIMRAAGMSLLDVQWTTPHLVSLGAVDVPRAEYLRLLADAVGSWGGDPNR
jgi:leucyl/phenylalanyl-tRNA--protein transferase